MADDSFREKVVSLINDAQLSAKAEKVQCLRKVHEVLIHKEINLLDSFYDEVVAFQQDPSHEVRKLVVGFVEEACKTDALYLDRALPQLLYMFDDDNLTVTKRVASAVISLYPLMLKTLSNMRDGQARAVDFLKEIDLLKAKVLELIYSENDGCHTAAIKFMEASILAQTDTTTLISDRHPFLPVTALRIEADNMMKSVATLAKSLSLSSVNIMACVSSLLNIAKKRADYVEYAVDVLQSLSHNMLESFTESQKNSIRKQLKVHCLNLLREPNAYDWYGQLEPLAMTLGCPQSEISKAFQKAGSGRKTMRSRSATAPPLEESDHKKAKDNDMEDDEAVALHSPAPLLSQLSHTHQRRKELSLIEEVVSLGQQLMPALQDIQSVIDVVMQGMEHLPDDIPLMFSQVYQVASSPGTPEQLQETSHLLAIQMISVGEETMEYSEMMDQSASLAGVRARMKRVSVLGSPKEGKRQETLVSDKQKTTISHIARSLGLFDSILLSDDSFVRYVNKEIDDNEDTMDQTTRARTEPAKHAEGGVAEILSSMQSEKRPKKVILLSPKKVPALPLQLQKLKKSRLYHITDLLEDSTDCDAKGVGKAVFKQLLGHSLDKEECTEENLTRIELAGSLARHFDSIKEDFVQLILAEPKKHASIISAWLYKEYVADHPSLTAYEDSLLFLLEQCQGSFGPRNQFFSGIVQAAPCVTPGVLQMVELFCHSEETSVLGLTTLKDLLMNGCGHEEACLQILFDATLSASAQCRVNALAIAKKLHASNISSGKIEEYLRSSVLKLGSDPPSQEDKHIFGEEWSEESVKMCLGLFSILLPQNHHFLMSLAEVYAQTSPKVKRMILKQTEHMISELPLSSKGVLSLLHYCPRGAETLVLRLLSLLVKSCVPPREVVNGTKLLYEQSGKDVRFLIPVIKGLTKREISDALPQIVSLSSGALLKTVIHKLVSENLSPITMTDLLVLLHEVDCTDQEDLMKSVIKVSSLCLAEKDMISPDVLRTVITMVLRQDPLPLIFMRTVLQTYSMYPQLIDFLLFVLDELIRRQIWTSPKLWQGFIHCCEVSKPHSIPLVLKLPKEQLQMLSQAGSSLKDAIDIHLQTLSRAEEDAAAEQEEVTDHDSTTEQTPEVDTAV